MEIDWADGSRSVVDFSSTVHKGGVFERMRDREFFVGQMKIGGGGGWLEWPGDLDFSADSLWYRSHPSEDTRRSQPPGDFGTAVSIRPVNVALYPICDML